MVKRTEKRTSWATYAAARSTRLFGKGKIILALVAVLLGVASPLGSSGGLQLEWVGAAIFAAVTVLQVLSSFLLFRLDRQGVRTTLSVYYAAAAFFCLAVTVGAAFRPIIGPFLGGMMSIGLAAIAFTAFYLLQNWDDLAQARPDAAVFLGSTHVLALVAVAAATVRALFVESGAWVSDLSQTTFLSLTALALPLAAGLWVRLSVQARANANSDVEVFSEPDEKVEEPPQGTVDETLPEPVRTPVEPQNLRQDSVSGHARLTPTNLLAAAVFVGALVTTTVLAVISSRRR